MKFQITLDDVKHKELIDYLMKSGNKSAIGRIAVEEWWERKKVTSNIMFNTNNISNDTSNSKINATSQQKRKSAVKELNNMVLNSSSKLNK